jgi:hypothetical protein
MAVDPRFACFKETMSAEMEVTPEIETLLLKALDKADFTTKTKTKKSKKTDSSKKRPLTGYQMYMKTQMKNPEVLAIAKKGSERMKLIANQWKALSKEDNEMWKQKAKQYVPPTEVAPTPAVVAPTPVVVAPTPVVVAPPAPTEVVSGSESESEEEIPKPKPKTKAKPKAKKTRS